MTPRISPAFRTSFLFVTGLLIAAFVAMSLESAGQRWGIWSPNILNETEVDFLRPLPPRPLSQQDLEDAQLAWRYFEANLQAETGLVDSVAGFPSTTIWDQGSYVLASVAAHRLELISDTVFSARMRSFLSSFAELPLFDDTLPNKAYDTRDLAMTDYSNNRSEQGIGWSALDMARMLVAFRVLEQHSPDLSPEIRSIISRWDLTAFAHDGELWGMNVDQGARELLQEGRLGYEQYGARASALYGLDVSFAMSAERNLSWTEVSGIKIPKDRRHASYFHAITPILSEPYLLAALEIGLDSEGRILAHKVYAAQQARFEDTGIPTMVSEDHVDARPSFLYSSVFANDQNWAVVSEAGNFHNELRTLSTKAVFGWDALYNTAYSNAMREELNMLSRNQSGWPAGIYETSSKPNTALTLNTNAVILEATHYKAFGPLLQ